MRRGYSLVEAVVALTLGLFVCAAVAGALRLERRLAQTRADALARADAMRTTAVVLGGEARRIRPAVDLRAAGADSLAMRIFRGMGVVCGTSSGGVLVRYRGVREPDPDKDSVVVPVDNGAVFRLLDSRGSTGACPPGVGEVLRWRLAGPAGGASAAGGSAGAAAGGPAGAAAAGGTFQPGTALLLFESGTYALADGALRYRRGHAGRQPLTGEWFDTIGTRLWTFAAGGGAAGRPADAAGIAASLEFAPAPRPPARLRIPFLNAHP